MSRSVFFSFHYQDDAWRASQVRNSWVTKSRSANRFLDAAEWETVQRKGAADVRSWIDRQIKGTSVTVVLIGSRTASRKWVQYEITKSLEKGNGLLGIRIHGIKDRNGERSESGHNPLDDIEVPYNGFWSFLSDTEKASEKFKTYDWNWNDGYKNLNDWIEEAAQLAGR